MTLCYVLIGFAFPTLKESDAMFLSEKAPDWHDGEFCHRCRVQFGLVQRKVDITHVVLVSLCACSSLAVNSFRHVLDWLITVFS